MAALKFMFHFESFLHVFKESELNRIYSNSIRIRIFNRIRIEYELSFLFEYEFESNSTGFNRIRIEYEFKEK